MKRFHIIISGRVQGVCFRAATQKTAQTFNLTGWVRNRDDGRVEAIFEGEDKNVDKMLKWCHTGPPASRVNEVLIEEESYTGEFRNFGIKYQ